MWYVLCSLDVCGPLFPPSAPSPWWDTPPDHLYFCFCLRWRDAITFCMPVWRQPSGRSQWMADWFSSCYQILLMMAGSGICWLTLLVSLALLHLFRGSIHLSIKKWIGIFSLQTKNGLNVWIEMKTFVHLHIQDAFITLCVSQKNTASSLRSASPSLTALRPPVEWTISSITRWVNLNPWKQLSVCSAVYLLKLLCWHLPNGDLVAAYKLVAPSQKHSLSHRMSRG